MKTAQGVSGTWRAGRRRGKTRKESHWRSISLIFAFSKENKFYKAKISKWRVISLSTSEESRVTMLVYEVVADQKMTVAFFASPSTIQSLSCAGDKMAVGLQNGGVLLLCAAFLAASVTQ